MKSISVVLIASPKAVGSVNSFIFSELFDLEIAFWKYFVFVIYAFWCGNV